MKAILRRGLILMLVTVGILAGGIVVDARLSGWTGLAETFRTGEPGRELQLSIQEGGLGNPRWYHRVAPLQAAVGFGGLRLSYPFPFSLGHPAIEIPWGQLRVLELETGGPGTGLLLSVSLPERARVFLRGELATVVREWLEPGGRRGQ
ncbi:MAG: hypothetical protein SGI84_08520 [Gemmatimonadota bacterium]|nr:hypothetical protein [Gemmatimonadota bacterium]